MFSISNNQPSSHVAIQIGGQYDIHNSSSPPTHSQLVQQIRHVSNNHIQWQSATMNRGAEASAGQLTSINGLTVSIQCTNLRSEDEQQVPCMNLNMTQDVDANISFYSPPTTFVNSGGNIANPNVATSSEPNNELPDLARASAEQLQDLSQYITQLEHGEIPQPAADERSPLHAEENDPNSIFNVEDFDRLLAHREQEDFEEANLPTIRAAEYRAALRENLASLAINNEVETSNFPEWGETFIHIEEVGNWRQSSLSAVGSFERLNQNSAESSFSVRAPIEGDDPSING